jgi:sulfur carrier protein
MDEQKKITITANGESFAVPAGQPLEAFLHQLGFRPGMVVVERNLEAVSPSEAAAVRLSEGDRLEIVRIVAGG